jgi:hypothetical protein
MPPTRPRGQGPALSNRRGYGRCSGLTRNARKAGLRRRSRWLSARRARLIGAFGIGRGVVARTNLHCDHARTPFGVCGLHHGESSRGPGLRLLLPPSSSHVIAWATTGFSAPLRKIEVIGRIALRVEATLLTVCSCASSTSRSSETSPRLVAIRGNQLDRELTQFLKLVLRRDGQDRGERDDSGDRASPRRRGIARARADREHGARGRRYGSALPRASERCS